jgi:intein/homing endonuclease/MoxR-like ATPase
MARKRDKAADPPADVVGDDPAADLQRPPAEALCADELARLAKHDAGNPRPNGWKLSPHSVVRFVLGDDELRVTAKFVGKRSFVERCVVSLATNRGLMLIGEPGTAKCLKHDALLVDTRTGERATIAEVCRRRDAMPASLGEDLRLRPQAPVEFLDNGVRDCYRVVTHLGRHVEVTLNHPLLTPEGWRPLRTLRVGDPIALPRTMPFFGEEQLSDDHVKVLGHLIAEGNLTRRTAYYCNTNEAMRRDFSEAVRSAFPGVGVHWYPRHSAGGVSGGRRGPHWRNPCTAWLKELGLLGVKSEGKFIPDIVFTLPRRQIALFLNRLFSGDGCCQVRKHTGQATIDYASKSKRLIRDVQHLLLRFGINARAVRKNSGHYRLYIQGRTPCLLSLTEIGLLDQERTQRVIAHLTAQKGKENPNLDVIPCAVWKRIEAGAVAAGFANATALAKAARGDGYRGGGPRRTQGLSRQRLLRLATHANDPDLIRLTQSDLYWDRITHVRYVGRHRVFDLNMAGTHDYVADDVIVHNSYLSELLAAAVSGDSTLAIQGSAGTTEDAIKYSWNYALLLAEGPSERSLVPAPLYRGMQEGKIVRFEELTRCPLEMQDLLLSILSDRMMAVPELPGDARSLFARAGFNVVATANTRDRGVNEMSAALKRRFNFETVHPIADLREEMALVQRETDKLLRRAGVPASLSADMTEVLVTTFHELRNGQDAAGNALEPLTTAMSTAEAVATGYTAGLHAWYCGGGPAKADHLVQHLIGTALKDAPDDLAKLRHYFHHAVKGRAGKAWKAFYEARELLP